MGQPGSRRGGKKTPGSARCGQQQGQAFKGGHLSPRAMPRRAHPSWLAPSDCEPPAGANPRNWVVGKQSRRSNYNASRLTSVCLRFVRSASGRPDHASRPLSLLWQRLFLAPLNGPAYTKSILLILQKRTAFRVFGPLAVNRLSLHELPSATSLKPLTNRGSTRYGGFLKRESSCDNSATGASGSVPGSLENQGRDFES